jgi:putative hemolysin
MIRRPPRQAFPELSYSNDSQPPLKRWLIRTVEGMSGRDRYASIYAEWRREVQQGGAMLFTRLLELVDLRLQHEQAWPPRDLTDGPLVMIANHPFGIGDGVAMLSLAERLGRPFRVMVAADLLKVPEMHGFALPVDFTDSKQALKNNLAVRHEAVRLLRAGVTIVIFPAGGVATAPRGFGIAEDLPWKIFVARLVQDAQASVIPVHFAGQCGRLFHLVSRPMRLADSDRRLARLLGRLSLTLRLSLLVREFAKLSHGAIEARIGPTIPWEALASLRDRRLLLRHLQTAVGDLADPEPVRRRRIRIPRIGPRLRATA